jgi:hypothetical protein
MKVGNVGNLREWWIPYDKPCYDALWRFLERRLDNSRGAGTVTGRGRHSPQHARIL